MTPTDTNDRERGTGPYDSGGQPVRKTYPASTAVLASVRNDFDSWLAGSGVGDEQRELAVLALAELAANAVEASTDADFDVTYVRRSKHLIELVVTNRARGVAEPSWPARLPSDPFAPRGRGLAIVQQVAESLHIDVTDHLTRVTATLLATGTGTSSG